ncbi:hypothetical protein SODALDRAFT_351325 [Sodiomyces alkalinus F11]|uniref:Zn(2)-C6 fungal-type domain-containing protein n=1 Tax=Sodiomyces alkalinus (strain CBS 110278 / VKM F-3762 / F11) TaxID=1314773 RepID=A0A3N2PUP2_SODAK|nr:hypothetical protein SODALDRAFT_351325 [Sodiomyces alkalinus F11]ROT38212.1 hypothetical protein SODALDRAFT_351325 [Sodiomyces alkalinus F11]
MPGGGGGGGGGGGDGGSSANGKLLTLACDSCRRRKVKCDAQTPECGSCRSSKIPCKYELPRKKRGPKPRGRDRDRGGDRDSSANRSGSGRDSADADQFEFTPTAAAPYPSSSARSMSDSIDIDTPSPHAADGRTTHVAVVAHPPLLTTPPTTTTTTTTTTGSTTVAVFHSGPPLPSSHQADHRHHLFQQRPAAPPPPQAHAHVHALGDSPWITPSTSASASAKGRLPSHGDLTVPCFDSRPLSPLEIQETLVAGVERFGASVEYIACRAVEGYIERLFGIVPIFHVGNLRASVSLLIHPFSSSAVESPAATTNSSSSQYGGPSSSAHSHASPWEELRTFTLLTSLCASQCIMSSIVPPGCDEAAISRCFLSASRAMLAHFEDRDISHPNSSSLIIRVFQSITFHCIGKTRMSMHLLNSAYSMTLAMRLYDESSLQGVDPIEAQIRRNCFWTLFASDKSASILNNMPSAIQELCLDRPITLAFEGPDEPNLLDGSSHPTTKPFERQLLAGFYMCNQMWAAGSDILIDMRILGRMYTKAFPGAADAPMHPHHPLDAPSSSVMRSYMAFCGMLDALPSWLRDPDSHTVADPDDMDGSVSAAATEYQRRGFWVQRANLLVTFHCLRLVILRRAAQLGLCHLLGFTNDESMLSLHRTEIASDMVAAATSVPFDALHTNSEPCVEKLRQAGMDLLEIAHKSSEAIAARARAILDDLLDVISKLNSRVSDELGGDLMN